MPSLKLDIEQPVFAYLSCFLTTTQAKQLAVSIVHMVNHHGLEYTVHYLKIMKLNFINNHNDCSVLYKPRGSYKPVFRLSFEKGLQLLNIYTSVKLSSVSCTQAYKFVSAVTSPFKGDFTGSISNDILDISSSVWKSDKPRFLHPYTWISSDKKSAPLCEKIFTRAKETDISFNRWMDSITNSPDKTRELYRTYAKIYAQGLYISEQSFRTKLMSGGSLYTNIDLKRPNRIRQSIPLPVAGRIGLIQERGAKLRAVANSHRENQAALSALGYSLYSLLRYIPWDCTFDQHTGFKFIQENPGKTMFSYDLSNATDTFPLSYQISVIRDLITSNQILMQVKGEDESIATKQELLQSLELFAVLSRSSWLVPPHLREFTKSDFLSWTNGQPLGLYPSFAIFALSHGNMVRQIEHKLGLSDTFRILGDDIVISNELVAELYLKEMTSFGCQISESKSIISKRIVEFAGNIVFDNKLMRVSKWQGFSKSNPTGPLEVLGLKGLSFVPKYLHDKIKLFCSLPEPIGLGLNPSGISFDERCPSDLLHLLFKKINNEEQKQISVLRCFNNLDLELLNRDRFRCMEKGFSGTFVPRGTILLPRGIDQILSVKEVLDVEHFNANVRSLRNWDQLPSKLSVPNVTGNPVRKEYTSLSKHPSLSRIYKILKNLISKRS